MSEKYFNRPLEKPNRVGKLHAAPDFRRELFDERKMIAVFLVEQIVGIDAENMRLMRFADGVIRRDIKNPVTGGASFKRVQFRLRTRQINFGANVQAFDAVIETELNVRGRNARQVEIQIGQLRAHVIGVEKHVEILVHVRVEIKFRAVITAFILRISEHRKIVLDINLPVAVIVPVSEINVVVDAVIKKVEFGAETVCLMAKAEIETVR